MKITNKELGLSLCIDDDLLQRLAEHGKCHYPKEFGGLLIGRYSDNKKEVSIEETLLPKLFSSSRYSFERQTADLKQILEEMFQQKPSLYYVGEWHTHPDSAAVPSNTDFQAMNAIVRSPDVFIKSPVLLIITITPTYNMPKFYFYHQGTIKQYED